MKHFQLHVSVTGVCDQRIKANRGAYGSRKIPANEKTEGFYPEKFAGDAIKEEPKVSGTLRHLSSRTPPQVSNDRSKKRQANCGPIQFSSRSHSVPCHDSVSVSTSTVTD
jgi:hypothetical protein